MTPTDSDLPLLAPKFRSVLPQPLPAHPRLLASADDWERLRAQIRSDDTSLRIFRSLRLKADRFLGQPPVERRLIAGRIMRSSRLAQERIATLAIVARLTEEDRYAERAVHEMMAVTAFEDWNTSHYLSTAELSMALAIGYDWLYEHLASEEQGQIATSLLEKGLKPSLEERPESNWWITAPMNWNQVCHGGLAAVAISLADREPELAEAVLRRAVENVPHAAREYAPDGAYPEGPMYWDYGTTYQVILMAALQKLAGTTWGLDAQPGLAESVPYILAMTTPSGGFYNYSDCWSDRPLEIPLFWMARHFDRPEWLDFEIRELNRLLDQYDQCESDERYRLLSLALLWRHPDCSGNSQVHPPLHWFGQGPTPVAVHRSAHANPRALYAGIKGGTPSVSHAHMDVGSFVLEADGIPWALDLGLQDYASLEERGIALWHRNQDSERWRIFRLGPEGHNILRFDGGFQQASGKARFIRFRSDGLGAHSVLDLTPLYSGHAKAVRRGLMFLDGRAVLLQDEWTTRETSTVVSWQMMTRADIVVSPGHIRLCQDGEGMTLHILSPNPYEVIVKSASELQGPVDAYNPGVRRIEVRIKTGTRSGGLLRVLAVPDSSGAVPMPPHRELTQWSSPLPSVSAED